MYIVWTWDFKIILAAVVFSVGILVVAVFAAT